MKAIEIIEPGKMRVVDRQMPAPGPEDVLLKLKYVGFCGSDLSTYLGKNTMVGFPRIPGHEISAVIEQTGNNVPEKFKTGMAVTVVPYTNCGQCSSCRRKSYNACRYNQTLGVQRDGAMAEYIAVPWQKVIADDELDAVQLALVEPLTVGFHAIDNAQVTDTDIVTVMGCGMIGSGAIIRSHLRGATVVAVDVDDDKLKLASRIGADYTINSKKQDLHEELLRITNGNGPDVVVEAAGNPVTYVAAIQEVCFSGRVVCIGYAKDDIKFPTRLWVQKELKIFGSRNANPADFEAVIKLMKQKTLDVRELVSEIVPVDGAGSAMKKWSENPASVLKILVKF